MNTAATSVLVEYVGSKDRKEDNVSGSGTVWNGPGDVQPVTLIQWGLLSKHPGVWRKVQESAPATLEPRVADAAKAPEAAKALSLSSKPEETGLSVDDVHAIKFEFPEAEGKPASQPARKAAAKTARSAE